MAHDQAVRRKVRASFVQGMPLSSAAEVNGIGYQTARNWKRQDALRGHDWDIERRSRSLTKSGMEAMTNQILDELAEQFTATITALKGDEKISAQTRAETLHKLMDGYGCLTWGVEAVQFQEFFRTELVKRSAAAGVPVPAVPLIPHTDKDLRIESLSPHVNNGLILFHVGHTVLNTQVRHWPEAEHDDGPDALHMLWMLAVSRAGGIPRIITGKRKT